jgi:hypothetical protein
MEAFWSIILVLNLAGTTTITEDIPTKVTGAQCLEIAENFLQKKPQYKKHVLQYGCVIKVNRTTEK